MLDLIRIVMVSTTHSGNIGAAARAMKNMGLNQLWLVDPVASIDDEALARSAGALDVMEQVRIVPDLESAIADCALVVGTSARSRHIPWPLMTPRQCAGQAKAATATGMPVALVFGRESSGLTNDELHRCHAHVHIPTNEEYSSLNVAQAIQVLSYEMRLAALGQSEETGPWGVDWDHPPASQGELDGMIRHLEQVMLDIGFLDPKSPGHLTSRMRRLFQRALPDKTEINILRGLLAAVQQKTRAGKPGQPNDKENPIDS